MTELVSRMTVAILHAIKLSKQQGGLNDRLLTEAEKSLLEDMTTEGLFVKLQKGWWPFTRNYYHVTEKSRSYYEEYSAKVRNLLLLFQKGTIDIKNKEKDSFKQMVREILSDNNVTEKVFLLTYQVLFTGTYDTEEIGFCLRKDFNGFYQTQQEVNERARRTFCAPTHMLVGNYCEDVGFLEELLLWYLVVEKFIDYQQITDIEDVTFSGTEVTQEKGAFVPDEEIDTVDTQRITIEESGIDNDFERNVNNYENSSSYDDCSYDSCGSDSFD